MLRLIAFLSLVGAPAVSDAVVPSRTIRADAVITEADVTLSAATVASGFTRIADVVGQEARVVLYPGRPILVGDIGPPAVITRNQLVQVLYLVGGLRISTEGRALERGAVGDRVRIMNLTSRATVFGQIRADGAVQVQN